MYRNIVQCAPHYFWGIVCLLLSSQGILYAQSQDTVRVKSTGLRFNEGMIHDPAQLFQGKITGLQIARPGGDPNTAFSVRLRGISTIYGNASPLIVVDGIPSISWGMVDPQDIAQVEILKEVGAAAAYGVRGASGVIRITTKSGEYGKPKTTYTGAVGIEKVARTLPSMSAEAFRQVPGAVDLGASTDWLDLVTRTGHAQTHHLAFSGGTDQTTYRASLNVRDVTGVGLRSGFQQLNGRLQVSQRAFKERALFNVQFASTSKTASYGDADAFRYAFIANPTMPVYDNSEVSPTAGRKYGGYAQRNVFDFYNPLALVEQNLHDGQNMQVFTRISGAYTLLKALRVEVLYARQWIADFRGDYSMKASKFDGGVYRNGLATTSATQQADALLETSMQYTQSFGATNLELVGGYAHQVFEKAGSYAQGGDFLTDAFTYNNLGAALDFANGQGIVSSFKHTHRLIAFYHRAMLDIKGTYFLSASTRYEGASRLGAQQKWGLFPAIRAAVLLSNLVTIPGIDQLKLTTSWGIAGNQPESGYLSLQRFGPQGHFYYNGAYIPTYVPISNANPDLSGEIKQGIDVGLEFTSSKGRWRGAVDIYTHRIKELLLPVSVPSPPNVYSQTWVNTGGVLENTGLEASLAVDLIQKKRFSWTSNLLLAHFNTKLGALPTDPFGTHPTLYYEGLGGPGQGGVALFRALPGKPLGVLWGPVQTGVNEAGVPQLADLNGDGVYCSCDADKQVIGQGLPTHTVGWENQLTTGRFDFNVFFRGVFGHDLVNSYRVFYENTADYTLANYNIIKTKHYDSRVKQAILSDKHVENAGYIQLDNMVIGYRISFGKEHRRIPMRLYVAAQHLFLYTRYTGLDPEVRYPDNDLLAPGVEYRTGYLPTRRITFGVQLEL